MADTDPLGQADLTDPEVREALASLLHPIVVFAPGANPTFYDADALDLGDDHDRWLAFIDQTVGGPAETVFRERGPRHAYYLNTQAYERGAPSEFNLIATVMRAHDQRLQVKQTQALYGTVVVTGFDVRTHLPRPLDAAQQMALVDALRAAEAFNQAAIEYLQDSGVLEGPYGG